MVLTRDGQWLVYVSELGGIAMSMRVMCPIPSREGRVFRSPTYRWRLEPLRIPDGETLLAWGGRFREKLRCP